MEKFARNVIKWLAGIFGPSPKPTPEMIEHNKKMEAAISHTGRVLADVIPRVYDTRNSDRLRSKISRTSAAGRALHQRRHA